MSTLRGRRTRYIHSLHRQYGPVVRVAPREISISDPDAVRQIHRIGTPFRKASWYKELTRQPDDDACTVFAIQDPRQASARRKLFQRSATRAAVAQWEPVVARLADLAVGKIKRDVETTGTADVARWWSMMTADVLSSLAFGESYRIVETEQKPPLITDIEAALVLGALRLELPWTWPLVRRIPLPGLASPAALFARIQGYGLVAVRNTRDSSRRGVKTLFAEMLPRDEQEQPLPDRVIALESTNIIIAGGDTTAAALTFLVYAVLKDPAVKEQLVRELAACPDEPGWDDLDRLPFLHGVIQETLRLYSPIPASLRREVPPEGALLGGYTIPPGVTVGTQAYTLHRDPAIWHHPERFDPHRWADPTPEMKAAFMPFGGAARTCLGQNIARLELLHATSRFFRECPRAVMSDKTTEADMVMVDYFTGRPKGGRCEITMS
ncbi:hypothetical protein E4U42_004006 [Claviceps africana]|uniref:Cytochrome P450 n=1 Tax=Claviceps africana TaxID=83212 RepID=A0A8K0NHC1_9HYPO|nr:hypothetical protein E4U42_004006 [Claviceps africana]